MSSRSHFAAGITGRCTAHATSVRGGRRPASTRSRLPAGSGRRRAEWDSGGLNDRHYVGRMVLPRPLTPTPKNEDISATATPQEEAPLLDLPG
jgi:hypothetical protein